MWEDIGGETLERSGGFWPTKETPEGGFLIGRIVSVEDGRKYDQRVIMIETVSGRIWPVAESVFLQSFGLPNREGEVIGIRYTGTQEVSGRRERMKTFEVRTFGDTFPEGAGAGDPEPAGNSDAD